MMVARAAARRRPSFASACTSAALVLSSSAAPFSSNIALAASASTSSSRVAAPPAFLLSRRPPPSSSSASFAVRPMSSAAESSSASEHPTESSAVSGNAGISSSSDEPPSIAANLEGVRDRITECVSKCNRPEGSVRLVAVSKTKPLPLLMDAYDCGQRSFGENYAQELIQKAEDMPDDVEWHFIGPLQSNKAAPLVKKVGLGRLKCVETVSTLKLANKLNRAVEDSTSAEDEEAAKLGIYLQVNTSGEETKSGVGPGSDLLSLAGDIATNCPRLSIDGLMTIGAPGDLSCFDALVRCREEVAAKLGRDAESLELSMGMSGDFEAAIERGATSVRVGSTIFGARDYSNLEK